MKGKFPGAGARREADSVLGLRGVRGVRGVCTDFTGVALRELTAAVRFFLTGFIGVFIRVDVLGLLLEFFNICRGRTELRSSSLFSKCS